MADLYIMCGAPGSGKSYWLDHHVKRGSVVSRDAIRFSLLNNDDDYFSHEDEVYKEFWKNINTGLKLGLDVFADQTSLTPKSRKYLIDHVHGYDNVNAIWIKTDLNDCLDNNAKRTGREYVPSEQLISMYKRFIPPSFGEGFFRIFKYENGIIKYKGR